MQFVWMSVCMEYACQCVRFITFTVSIELALVSNTQDEVNFYFNFTRKTSKQYAIEQRSTTTS